MGQTKTAQGWRMFSRLLLAMIVIWLAGCVILAGWIHYTGLVDEARPVDAIVVLGAGLSRDGRPGWALTRRSAHAADLYLQGYADAIICTGGISPDQTRSEADGCRQVLERQGVPRSAILLEERSRSTEENAIFSRQIIEANGFDDVLLVSDSYHVFRGRFIFGLRGMDVTLSPVHPSRIRSESFYVYSLTREIVALHWQVVKEILNLPFTNVPIA